MGTSTDPWCADCESESDAEAASRKKNPNYKPGRWFNQCVCLREVGRVRILRKGEGEPLGDWEMMQFRLEILARTGDFPRYWNAFSMALV